MVAQGGQHDEASASGSKRRPRADRKREAFSRVASSAEATVVDGPKPKRRWTAAQKAEQKARRAEAAAADDASRAADAAPAPHAGVGGEATRAKQTRTAAPEASKAPPASRQGSKRAAPPALLGSARVVDEACAECGARGLCEIDPSDESRYCLKCWDAYDAAEKAAEKSKRRRERADARERSSSARLEASRTLLLGLRQRFLALLFTTPEVCEQPTALLQPTAADGNRL